LGKQDSALECYEKGLELLPENVQLLNNKGLLHFQRGQYEEAADCFSEAVDIDKKFREGWNNKVRFTPSFDFFLTFLVFSTLKAVFSKVALCFACFTFKAKNRVARFKKWAIFKRPYFALSAH
jgi:tetratricopeptide (TPR) repeat protein